MPGVNGTGNPVNTNGLCSVDTFIDQGMVLFVTPTRPGEELIKRCLLAGCHCLRVWCGLVLACFKSEQEGFSFHALRNCHWFWFVCYKFTWRYRPSCPPVCTLVALACNRLFFVKAGPSLGRGRSRNRSGCRTTLGEATALGRGLEQVAFSCDPE